jgi:hypothetical protein
VRFVTYNNKRLKELTLKKRDKVYLLRRNIDIKRLNSKFDFKKIGSFKIKKVKSKITFKLQLPKTIKIYPVFHISLFEPVLDNILIDFQQEAETDYDEYEIEEILDSRQKGRTKEYLIK